MECFLNFFQITGFSLTVMLQLDWHYLCITVLRKFLFFVCYGEKTKMIINLISSVITSTITLAILTSCLPKSRNQVASEVQETNSSDVTIKSMEEKIDAYLTSKKIQLFEKIELGHFEEAWYWGLDLPESQKANGKIYWDLGKIIFRDFAARSVNKPIDFLALHDHQTNLQSVAEFEPLPYDESTKENMPKVNRHVLLHILLARPSGAKVNLGSQYTEEQKKKVGTIPKKLPYAGAFLMYKVFQTKVGDDGHYTEMTLHPENTALEKHYYPKFGFEESEQPPHWRFVGNNIWMKVTYREFVKRLSQIVTLLEKRAKPHQEDDL
jgi:hypothetical protein